MNKNNLTEKIVAICKEGARGISASAIFGGLTYSELSRPRDVFYKFFGVEPAEGICPKVENNVGALVNTFVVDAATAVGMYVPIAVVAIGYGSKRDLLYSAVAFGLRVITYSSRDNSKIESQVKEEK